MKVSVAIASKHGSTREIGEAISAASSFTRDLSAQIKGRPVWLFSTWPVGEPRTPADPAINVEEQLRMTGAIEHQMFAGQVDKSQLRLGERSVLRALRVPDGDYRDWTDVRDWARSIAATLSAA